VIKHRDNALRWINRKTDQNFDYVIACDQFKEVRLNMAAIVMTIKAHIENDPSFSFITARFLFNDLYKDVLGADEFSKHFPMLHEKGFIDFIKKP
jgi:hypothetical protein